MLTSISKGLIVAGALQGKGGWPSAALIDVMMLTEHYWLMVQDEACPRACTAVLSDQMQSCDADAWGSDTTLGRQSCGASKRVAGLGRLSRQFSNQFMAEGEGLDLACSGSASTT